MLPVTPKLRMRNLSVTADCSPSESALLRYFPLKFSDFLINKTIRSKKQWRERLTVEQFHICREGGTETPFSGQYCHYSTPGKYVCVCCGALLFSSAAKFDSGSGWPSFYQPYDSKDLREEQDFSHGVVRTEVRCGRCDAHLGHVFPDGPAPTGLRYCINSVALNLIEKPDF